MRNGAWVAAMMSAVLLAGCAWVKLTPGGEKVRVLSASEVNSCRYIGDTTVSLMARVGAVKRNEEKVQKELEALARNSGADMGGDTVVAAAEPEDGKQRYAVYQCIGPRAQ